MSLQTFKNAVNSQVKTFGDFPDEILDQILSEIDLRRDIVNFAQASRRCSTLAIPRHTEYRILHIGTADYADIWAHLASRRDLTRNIREVTIGSGLPRVPSIRDREYKYKSQEQFQADVVIAIGHMNRLELFVWGYTVFPDPRNLGTLIFEALAGLSSIRHLSLDIERQFQFETPVEDWKLWNISQLRSLRLGRDLWYSQSVLASPSQPVKTWMQSLTDLECLSVSYQVLEQYGETLLLPNLKRLEIHTGPVGVEIAPLSLDFLQRHRTLEELSWVSYLDRYGTPLPGNVLPNLKKLACSPSLLFQLQASATRGIPRQIEVFLLAGHHPSDFVKMVYTSRYFNGPALRSLHVNVQWRPKDLQRLASAFPMLQDFTLDWKPDRDSHSWKALFSGFAHFTNLKILHTRAVWGGMWGEITNERRFPSLSDRLQAKVDKRIQKLADKCPNLRRITGPRENSYLLEIVRENGCIVTRELVEPSRKPFDWFQLHI